MPAAPETDLYLAVRERFETTDEIVTALSSVDLETASSQDRVKDWRRNLNQQNRSLVEHTVPRIIRHIKRSLPGFSGRAVDGRDRQSLEDELDRLAPWSVSLPVAHGLSTMEGMKGAIARKRLLYRRDLINGTLADLFSDELAACSVLDIGCQAGVFSLDLAERGAHAVRGVDLRDGNIAQARFLAEHHGVDGPVFDLADADELPVDQRYDIVLNLGLLYHMTRPLDLLRTTRLLCRRAAIIDTICSTEPVSGFLLLGDKDVTKWDEGRDEVELHPTYRAVVDGLRFAGFTHIFEIEGRAEPVHRSYQLGGRRCFLALP